MSGKINPEGMEPTTFQSFDQSPRDPAVGEWGEAGGVVPSPDAGAGRVTPEGPAVPADAGLKY